MQLHTFWLLASPWSLLFLANDPAALWTLYGVMVVQVAGIITTLINRLAENARAEKLAAWQAAEKQHKEMQTEDMQRKSDDIHRAIAAASDRADATLRKCGKAARPPLYCPRDPQFQDREALRAVNRKSCVLGICADCPIHWGNPPPQ